MTIDTAKLRALAEAATPGPWRMETGVYQDPDGDDDLAFARGPMIKREPGGGWDGLWRKRAEANAAFIAAANPQAVIALLDRIAELEQACDAHAATANESGDRASALRRQLTASQAEVERLEAEVDALNQRIGGLT